jgi:hypothetical protein
MYAVRERFVPDIVIPLLLKRFALILALFALGGLGYDVCLLGSLPLHVNPFTVPSPNFVGPYSSPLFHGLCTVKYCAWYFG